jgi:hypothetical protein
MSLSIHQKNIKFLMYVKAGQDHTASRGATLYRRCPEDVFYNTRIASYNVGGPSASRRIGSEGTAIDAAQWDKPKVHAWLVRRRNCYGFSRSLVAPADIPEEAAGRVMNSDMVVARHHCQQGFADELAVLVRASVRRQEGETKWHSTDI